MRNLGRTILSILQQRRWTTADSYKSSARAPLLGAALLSVSALLASGAVVAAEGGTTPTDFQISSASLADALSQFGAQTGMQVVYAPELARGLKSRALSGRLTADAALKQLLQGTGLTWSYVNGHTVVLKRDETGTSAKKNSDAPRVVTELEEITVTAKIPEILVVGSRITNADIRRTEDDPQPYVVFDSDEIAKSQVSTVEEFLRTRLTMNTSQQSESQQASSSFGNQSSINLRGLGPNQTLVLVNGRRMPSVSGIQGGNFRQPDINGIPIAAIERIEVLPSTASGIYGGGATGGVINIVLRQDFTGIEVRATYGDTFDTRASQTRYDASAGFSLEEGRTSILLSGSYSDSEPLLVGDRDFAARGRALMLTNASNTLIGPSAFTSGYTSNINTFAGNLVLDDGTPLNSPMTHVPAGYAGPASDGGAALVANAGRYDLGLPDDLNGQRQSLLNNPRGRSLSMYARRAFHDRIEAFADVSFLDNLGRTEFSSIPVATILAADAPNNPFTSDVVVTFPNPGIAFTSQTTSETYRAIGGIIARLPFDWSLGAEYSWSRSRTEQIETFPAVSTAGQNAISNGTLDVMRDLNAFPIDYAPYLLPTPNSFQGPFDTTLRDTAIRFTGPTVRIPGGPIVVSGLLEYRREDADDAFADSIDGNAVRTTQYYPYRSQTVKSAYLETIVPIASEANARTALQSLELQMSVRRDDYATDSVRNEAIAIPSRDSPRPPLQYFTNEATSDDYTVALRYSPVRDVVLRASLGTGFIPPSLSQIASRTLPNRNVRVRDPKRENVERLISGVTLVNGGNPALEPETSDSWSAGLILTPRFLPGFRLSVDYTEIEKSDEIGSVSSQFILDNEDSLPGRVMRGPNLPTDPPGFAGPITQIDLTLLNLATSGVNALDIQLDYERETRFGTFQFFTVATRESVFERQLLPTSPTIDSVGFSDGPLKWRINGGLAWSNGPLTVGWNAQYYDSYLVFPSSASAATAATATTQQGARAISSQTYHDVFGLFRFEDPSFGHGFLSNAELLIGVKNVFDKSPPILATTSTVGGYSSYGDPRLRSFSVSVRMNF